jgi:hypothetical protein
MPSSVPSFAELLDGARQSAVHLEMRDAYGVAGEADDFARWQTTGQRDIDPGSPYWGPWVDLIRRTVARGVPVRRATSPATAHPAAGRSAPTQPRPRCAPTHSRPSGPGPSRTTSTSSAS